MPGRRDTPGHRDSRWLPVNSSHGHYITQSCRHSVNSSPVNSSQARFFHRVISSHGQVVTQSSRHNKVSIEQRVGAQNSVGMQILRVTTNVQNLGATRPLRGDSRGKCFFDPFSLKILVKFSKFFHILLTTIRPTKTEKNIG